VLNDAHPMLDRVLQCAECDRPGPPGAPCWETMLPDDEPPQVLLFCPRCVEREFSDSA